MSTDDAVGLVAGTLTTISFVPQVIRIVRLRHADDLSWWMFSIFSIGSALWLTYGIRLAALPVILANAVTLGLALLIMVLKWHYDRARKSPHAPSPGGSEHQS
jgi:MtN3 and saliva related transmembrane protein